MAVSNISNTTLFDRPPGGGIKSDPDHRPKRKRARKIRGELGPFETSVTCFDRGERAVEIVRITPAAIVYRLRGLADEFSLPHGAAFLRAVSIRANIDTAPRSGAIRRG